MADIVEQLRNAKPWIGKLGQDAADEIERLRAQVDFSTDKAIPWDTVAGKNARIAKLRYAIIGYLEVFDRCGGSEAVSPDTFAAARQQLREALSFRSDRGDP